MAHLGLQQTVAKGKKWIQSLNGSLEGKCVIQSRQVTRADQFSPTVWALALNVMIRLTSQFILITSLSPITMGEAIVSSNYK